MDSATGKTRCVTCGKGNAILKCGGCVQDFCYNHFGDHRQVLNATFEEIEVNRDILRQDLSEQIMEMKKHPLMQQIDQWETESIDIIRQAADEARQILCRHTNKHFQQIEVKLYDFTDQLRQSRRENDFVETDLQRWNEQLTQLTNELNRPSCSLQQDTKPLVNQIHVVIEAKPLSGFVTGANLSWMQTGIVVAGGNGNGARLTQLFMPVGIFIDDNKTMYIADMMNDRIVEWRNGADCGRVVAGGNGQGKQTNQLNCPNDVILDKKTNSLIIYNRGNSRIVRWSLQDSRNGQIILSNSDGSGRLCLDRHGYLYVSNTKNHMVERWRMEDSSVEVVAGGNGEGDRLDQLCEPTFIVVDDEQTVYVSDWRNHRVMKWLKDAKQGIVVAGGQNEGNHLTQLSGPQGLAIDPEGSLHVADNANDRVMCLRKECTQGVISVGGNGRGEQLNQLNSPQGLSFDQEGNLYVIDQWNHRVLKFPILPHAKL